MSSSWVFVSAWIRNVNRKTWFCSVMMKKTHSFVVEMNETKTNRYLKAINIQELCPHEKEPSGKEKAEGERKRDQNETEHNERTRKRIKQIHWAGHGHAYDAFGFSKSPHAPTPIPAAAWQHEAHTHTHTEGQSNAQRSRAREFHLKIGCMKWRRRESACLL